MLASTSDPWGFLRNLIRALLHVLIVGIPVGLIVWNGFLISMLLRDFARKDFAVFYYSTLAFLHGEDMYVGSEVAMAQLSAPSLDYLPNLNPPHFQLLLFPFALFTKKSAALIWEILTLCSLAGALLLIVRETKIRLTPWRCWVGAVGILSFVATQVTLLFGQVSFLLFLICTLAWIRARQGYWTAAGMYLGIGFSVKPFLLIFLPYLVLRRQWRSLAAAVGSALLCFAVGLFIFGIDAYASWLQRLASVTWSWHALNASLLGFFTRILQETSIYLPIVSAPQLVRPLWIVAAVALGGVTLLLTTGDESHSATDRGFAQLLLAALLISPLGWGYYLWLPVGPLAMLSVTWWSSSTEVASPPVTVARYRNFLCLLALPGLVWPFLLVTWLQPNAWATVSVGSVYFWSTFLLWLALFADWRATGGTFSNILAKIAKSPI